MNLCEHIVIFNHLSFVLCTASFLRMTCRCKWKRKFGFSIRVSICCYPNGSLKSTQPNEWLKWTSTVFFFNLPKVDQTTEEEAWFIGSICGCRRANWTCNEMPDTVFECKSLIARSADSVFTNVIKPRPFSISIETLTILPNVANWFRKKSSVTLLPDTQTVFPVRCFSVRWVASVASGSLTFLSFRPRSSRSRSVAICWYTEINQIIYIIYEKNDVALSNH